MELHRERNALQQTAVPWRYAVCTCAPQEALRTRQRACDGFFRRGQLTKSGNLRGKLGSPQRKTPKQGLGGFGLTGTIVVVLDALPVPRLGRLRLKQRGDLPPSGVKVLS